MNMDASIRRVGKTLGHEMQPPTEVHEYQLVDTGGFAITVWDYGATLVAVCPFPDDAKNMVLRLPDLASYESREKNSCLMGSTIGRYARGIADGSLCLDGRKYQLTRNHGRHHFHGGSIGFDRFVWKGDITRSMDKITLSLKLDRPDGDQGYPGSVSVETRYSLCGNLTLEIEHRATATAPTILSMTNHAYWNLSDRGSLNDHILSVNAETVIVNDDELMPVGDPVPVGELGLDFIKPRRVGNQRVDNCFPLKNSDCAYSLEDPESGRRMLVQSNQPVLAIYTADGYAERPRGGLCLQTTDWPNPPNRTDILYSRLDPTFSYYHRTEHLFSRSQADYQERSLSAHSAKVWKHTRQRLPMTRHP